jgi:hypothetical protein
MQNADWIALLRLLPQTVHNRLMFVLQNRMEISVETLFRLEPTVAVVRGRLGGTTDGGLLFLVPYDQLAGVYLNQEIKDTDVAAYFGEPPQAQVAQVRFPSRQGVRSQQGTAPAPAPTAAAPAAPAPAGSAPAVAGLRPSMLGTGPATAGAPAKPAEAPATAARNNLLERLRAARNAALPPGVNGKH